MKLDRKSPEFLSTNQSTFIQAQDMKLTIILIVFIFFNFGFGKPTPKPEPKPILKVDPRGRSAQKALIQHIQQMMMILQGDKNRFLKV